MLPLSRFLIPLVIASLRAAMPNGQGFGGLAAVCSTYFPFTQQDIITTILEELPLIVSSRPIARLSEPWHILVSGWNQARNASAQRFWLSECPKHLKQATWSLSKRKSRNFKTCLKISNWSTRPWFETLPEQKFLISFMTNRSLISHVMADQRTTLPTACSF